MVWAISAEIEAVLWAAAERHIPVSARKGRALTEAIIERSRLYTSQRDELGTPIERRSELADLAARALFFTVADAAKSMIPLAELERQGLVPRGPLEILDIGAGAGAMSLGVLDYLGRTCGLAPVAIRALDKDARALAIFADAARELAARWDVPITVHAERLDLRGAALPRGKAGGADLVLAGTVLNELDAAERPALVKAMLEAASPEGSVIIIEPALRETSRALHEIRDWVIDSGLAQVFAPCTRRLAPCPSLADERDWCHEDRPTSLPERTDKLAALTGLRQYGLKFSYLTLRRATDAQLDVTSGCALRLISGRLESKGKIECIVCSDAGRSTVRLLRRDRRLENRGFERSRRGDVLVMPRRLASGGDLGRDDVVELVRAPEPEN